MVKVEMEVTGGRALLVELETEGAKNVIGNVYSYMDNSNRQSDDNSNQDYEDVEVDICRSNHDSTSDGSSLSSLVLCNGYGDRLK